MAKTKMSAKKATGGTSVRKALGQKTSGRGTATGNSHVEPQAMEMDEDSDESVALANITASTRKRAVSTYYPIAQHGTYCSTVRGN